MCLCEWIGAIITAVPIESSNAYYAADVAELLRALKKSSAR